MVACLESPVTVSDHQSWNSHVLLPGPCLAPGSRKEPGQMPTMPALCLVFPPSRLDEAHLGSRVRHGDTENGDGWPSRCGVRTALTQVTAI